VEPLIGHVKMGTLDADVMDSFYAELRRCRVHCSGKARRQLDHRTKRPHTCDDRCRPHECKPLGASSIRQIQFILSSAYKKAVRWRAGRAPVYRLRWVSLGLAPYARRYWLAKRL
jgi:integrase